MQPNGYANLLRQYRAQERARDKDFTAQALEVFKLRADTISASDVPDEQKQREMAKAITQWQTFMQREMPANG